MDQAKKCKLPYRISIKKCNIIWVKDNSHLNNNWNNKKIKTLLI